MTQRAAATGAHPADRSEAATKTVLVVEDEAPVRSIVRRVLQRHGYTVLEADNGYAALHAAAAHPSPIHLLLADVVMPRLDGFQLAERLRHSQPSLRVLFMSGYSEDITAAREAAPPGAFLEKPFSPDNLAAKVAELLTR